MRLDFKFPSGSIDSLVTHEDLPDFVVLVGPNGAGKSHLFRAIYSGATTVDDLNNSQHGNNNEIKLYELAQLVPTAGGEQPPSQFRDVWGRVKPVIQNVAQQFGYPQNSGSLEQNMGEFTARVSQNLNIPQATIEAIHLAAGKPLPLFTDKDYREHFPLYQSAADLFHYSLTDIFLTYFEKWDTNKYQKFLNQNEAIQGAEWIEDVEFEKRYGQPPWKVLDEVLGTMGLEYRFVEPINLPLDVPYQPRLIASDTKAIVTLDALSSGERVLLALASGLYAGKHMADSVRKPQLLLLDEADASLHPSMIQSLLNVTQNVLCGEHGVKVILATHSPTTVALSPESALYSLSRTGQPRLRKVAREPALAQLTVGIPTLSVRVEDRRQVFVESEKDEKYFDMIYRSLRPNIDAHHTLQFIASGSGGAGNCDAVIQLVGALRGKGNHSIYGIIDRDHNSRSGSPDYVEYMPERYSIENYVLDPLLLGALLLRAKIRTAEQMGLEEGTNYFDITGSQAQSVIDAVERELWSNFADDEASGSQLVQYAGDFQAQVSQRGHDTQGHALESAVRETFPQLNSHRDLMLEVCRTIIAERPRLAPASFVSLFVRLTDARPAE